MQKPFYVSLRLFAAKESSPSLLLPVLLPSSKNARSRPVEPPHPQRFFLLFRSPPSPLRHAPPARPPPHSTVHLLRPLRLVPLFPQTPGSKARSTACRGYWRTTPSREVFPTEGAVRSQASDPPRLLLPLLRGLPASAEHLRRALLNPAYHRSLISDRRCRARAADPGGD